MIARLFPLRARLVWLVLILILPLTGPRLERIGDRYQIALPLMALACEAARGGALEYAGRFAFGWLTMRASKAALGTHPVNARPHGGYQGMPSGHTWAASFGAASLAGACLKRHPLTQAAVILAAGTTGASRIEAGAHSALQVIIGGIWGALTALAFGKTSALRRRLAHLWAHRRTK